MTKFKTTLILSAAALCLSAAPSYAQYGSGTPSGNTGYSNSQGSAGQAYTKAERKAARKARKELKKRKKALKEKEAMEKELAMKEKEVMLEKEALKSDASSYGSGDAAPAATYGSGDAAAPATTYGSGDAAPAYSTESAAPTSSLPINCPAGTTAQTDGTCMLTSGSFPTG